LGLFLIIQIIEKHHRGISVVSALVKDPEFKIIIPSFSTIAVIKVYYVF
jgi:hypothetical protein